MARDTKLGPEEITRDIPNVGEERCATSTSAASSASAPRWSRATSWSARSRRRARPMTPEEKLLRAIFGEKASRRARHLAAPAAGRAGTVVEVRVFNRHGIDIDERARAIQRRGEGAPRKDARRRARDPERATYSRLARCCSARPPPRRPRASRRAHDRPRAARQRRAHEWWKFAVKDDAVQAISKP
jgi:DNA-directed RNA polymerase subunit beta